MFVFRMILFVLILKCFAFLAHSESALLPNKPSEVKEDKNVTSIKLHDITSANKTDNISTVIGEGGEKYIAATSLNSDIVKSTTPQLDININTTDMTKSLGREDNFVNTNKNNSLSNTEGETENVENKHYGREGELTKTEAENKVTSHDSKDNISTTSTFDKSTKPITEEPMTIDNQSSKTPHNRIVPKKGVNFTEPMTNNQTNTSSTLHATTEVSSTTTKTTTIQSNIEVKKIRKPTVTTGSEDSGDALVKQKSNNSTPKVPTIEYYQTKNEEENKRSNFIIPIVAVIFSVPIVAIILNISYKRCKEWWSHRHYSRMDFLIDGMYNN